jgi:uncharacterized protein (TIGR03437 family)
MTRFMGLLAGLILTIPLCGQTVRFRTSHGNIDVVLLPNDAPATVANFLNYVNKAAYTGTFFHRSVSGFIIQGGGYTFRSGQLAEIPADPAVRNEFKVLNTRGTLAMAKLGNDPNSATNQWFFNLADNRDLNMQNGGFTVFGRVANSASLAVMDTIARVPVYNVGSPFDSLPLANYRAGSEIAEANLVLVTSIENIDLPVIDKVQSAGAFGGWPAATIGSYIEIFGSNLAGTTRSWTGADFNGTAAPTSLDGVTVTVNGQPAFISYISPVQINAQVPGNLSSSVTTAPVIVTVKGVTSATVALPIRTVAGGLLAPPEFKAEGRQYVVAIRGDGTFVTNGKSPNVPGAPAKPGETILLYGTGFGPVTPSTPVAGQIAQGATSLVYPLEIRIGGARAQMAYAGLTSGLVGVYQFNVVVPQDLPAGDAALAMTQNGLTINQGLWIPIQGAQ